VKVHLPCEEAKSLKELAQSKGLDDAELILQWVLERVHAE
jgi:aryl-alcohol dehydrogenase-like predicted oxidoreductase